MIAVGFDHGGFVLKEALLNHLKERGIEFRDFGTFSSASCDYPDIAFPVAHAVANGECERGILVCGTGIGMCIAANKVAGIRCALCSDVYSARLTRQHNDSNVLALGARVLGEGLFLEIVDAWLDGKFEGGRHQTRIDKVAAGESAKK